jgi:hypothetical protein
MRHPSDQEGKPMSEILRLSLEYVCRACGIIATAPAGTDPVDLKFRGGYCDACGGNETDAQPPVDAPAPVYVSKIAELSAVLKGRGLDAQYWHSGGGIFVARVELPGEHHYVIGGEHTEYGWDFSCWADDCPTHPGLSGCVDGGYWTDVTDDTPTDALAERVLALVSEIR